jgi:purine-binding chemotaxis protein CheW
MGMAQRREESQGAMVQVIGFRIGAEQYGLDILKVREIIRVGAITRMPRAPAFVRGIINLRGDVIPVLSLGERFGLVTAEDGASARVIVVEIGGRLIGMMVDSVSAVLRVPVGQIDPPPPIIGGMSRRYVRGLAKLEKSLVILLDIERVLSRDEQAELGVIAEDDAVVPERVPATGQEPVVAR